MISMKKVEAIFIASELKTVRELLSEHCGLDVATSRVNESHDRSQAVFTVNLPLIRLETVVACHSRCGDSPGKAFALPERSS
jgi:hypothetical protein